MLTSPPNYLLPLILVYCVMNCFFALTSSSEARSSYLGNLQSVIMLFVPSPTHKRNE